MQDESNSDDEIEKPDPNVYQPEEGSDDEEEIDRRIRRVRERLERLTIVGSPDVDVDGAWDSGYVAKKKNVIELLTVGCNHHAATAQIDPSGVTISLACGCVEGGGGDSWTWSDETFNDNTLLLNRVSGPPDPDIWTTTTEEVLLSLFSTVTDCSGPPDETNFTAIDFFLICEGNTYTIGIVVNGPAGLSAGDGGWFFYATGIPGVPPGVPLVIPNQASCGESFVAPAYFSGNTFPVVATGGQVTIQFA